MRSSLEQRCDRHIRLLSRLHCAICRARSHDWITAITAFRGSLMRKKMGKLSSLRCSFPIVRRDTGNLFGIAGQRLFESATKMAHAAHAHGHQHGHHHGRLLLHIALSSPQCST